MKTLHLIRHAKSSWKNPGLADIERPLNERGRKACILMAEPILDAGCHFEHVYCSIARRAHMTIQGIDEALPGTQIEWELVESLYTFSSSSLLDWIRGLDDAVDEAVLIGHNPAFTDLVNELGNQFIANLPTCGYVQLQLEPRSWRNAGQNSGKLETFLSPKMFG